MNQISHFDDPVAAYDLLAANYAALAEPRRPYLRKVESLIIERIPPGCGALLDVGGGDGTRALRIARAAGIGRVVLVEPSTGMALRAHQEVEWWPLRAENLQPEAISERFGVITCLWNVLGHIRGHEKRERALGAIAHLLSAEGLFFMDVNHRYNLPSYGLAPTGLRWLYDRLVRNADNGDVRTRWSVGEGGVSTYGHVFTHREIACMADVAGLEIRERIVVDYDDGRLRRFPCLGNLLYTFRRSSRIDSSSAPQTSRISTPVS